MSVTLVERVKTAPRIISGRLDVLARSTSKVEYGKLDAGIPCPNSHVIAISPLALTTSTFVTPVPPLAIPIDVGFFALQTSEDVTANVRELQMSCSCVLVIVVLSESFPTEVVAA
jgi:hypothetical protein